MQFISNYWNEKSDEWLAQKLGVTKEAVERKRQAMGLKRERKPCAGGRRSDSWPEIELEYLKMGYGRVHTHRMAEALGRIEQTVRTRARKLGLSGSGMWIRDPCEVGMTEEEYKEFLALEREVKRRRNNG